MTTYRHLTDEEAAKNLAENRMLTQLPHEDWCDFDDKHKECCGAREEWYEFGSLCRCITVDVVAKLREMGLMT